MCIESRVIEGGVKRTQFEGILSEKRKYGVMLRRVCRDVATSLSSTGDCVQLNGVFQTKFTVVKRE